MGILSGVVQLDGAVTLSPGSTFQAPGQIIQVAQSIFTGTQTIASGSYVEIQDLSVSLNPANANSKFLVTVCINIGVTGTNEGFHGRLYRNGSQVIEARGSRTGSRDPAWFHCGAHYTSGEQYAATAQYLDSPNTTDTLTYALYGRGHSAPYIVRINTNEADNDADYNSATMSSITVMEIAG